MSTDEEKEKLKEVYHKYDSNGNGKLSFEEFFNMLRILNSRWQEPDAQTLFQSCDQDLSGDLDFDEFVDYITGDDSGQTLFLLEAEHTEEEAKEALLNKSHQIRSAASKNAKDKGLVWRDMTWRERLAEVTELEHCDKEDRPGRAAHAPCKDNESHFAAAKSEPASKSEAAAPDPPKEEVVTDEEVNREVAKAAAAPAVQPQRLEPKKFGVAAMNQEKIVNYSLSDDDLSFAGEDKEVVKFKEYLKTASGPLDSVNIIKFIAKGTAGFVFLAELKDSGNRVAMKLIRMTQAVSGVREWYVSKLLVAAGIENVVLTYPTVYVMNRDDVPEVVYEQVKDAGPVPFYMCMLQDLMPWGTLEDLAADGEMSAAIMFNALEMVARTLAEMHEHDIQHKDVKPENIMLVMKDKVVTAAKLCDLGSSQIGKNPKAFKDDIRRFGVTVFSIATGEGWTKNRLIRESHDALVERLAESVADSHDENMKKLPDVVKQILDGGLSMAEVADIMKEISSTY